jgi:hypothetical protein
MRRSAGSLDLIILHHWMDASYIIDSVGTGRCHAFFALASGLAGE